MTKHMQHAEKGTLGTFDGDEPPIGWFEIPEPTPGQLAYSQPGGDAVPHPDQINAIIAKHFGTNLIGACKAQDAIREVLALSASAPAPINDLASAPDIDAGSKTAFAPVVGEPVFTLPWDQAPEWAMYGAVDHDNTLWWYETRPYHYHGGVCWRTSGPLDAKRHGTVNGHGDWRASLQRRPA